MSGHSLAPWQVVWVCTLCVPVDRCKLYLSPWRVTLLSSWWHSCCPLRSYLPPWQVIMVSPCDITAAFYRFYLPPWQVYMVRSSDIGHPLDWARLRFVPASLTGMLVSLASCCIHTVACRSLQVHLSPWQVGLLSNFIPAALRRCYLSPDKLFEFKRCVCQPVSAGYAGAPGQLHGVSWLLSCCPCRLHLPPWQV